jgi:hypothetical protein
MRGPNAMPQTKRCCRSGVRSWRPTGRRAANPHRAPGTTPDHQPAHTVGRGPQAKLPAARRWPPASLWRADEVQGGWSPSRQRCRTTTSRASRRRTGGQRPATRQHQPTPNDKDAKLRGAIAALLLVTELSLLVSHRSGRRPPGFRRFRLAGLGSAAPAGSGGWSCARRRRSPCTSPQSGGTAGCARRGRRSWR